MENLSAQVACAIITGIAGIITSIIGGITIKSSRDTKKRAERRMKESLLSLEMMNATLQLTIVCSNALTGGHNNGNVETARKKALEAEQNYRTFEREILVEEIK